MAELVETDTAVIDGVDRGEDVDERLGARSRLRGGELRHVVGRAQDDAFDVRHDVERRSVHRVVVAEREDLRYRDRGIRERADDRVFAGHVVRGRQHVPERRASQNPFVRAVADEIGEVRPTAGDQLGPQRLTRRALDLGREPTA